MHSRAVALDFRRRFYVGNKKPVFRLYLVLPKGKDDEKIITLLASPAKNYISHCSQGNGCPKKFNGTRGKK